MTTSVDEVSTELRPCPMQPVIAVVAEHNGVDAELIELIRHLGFYAVLHDLETRVPQPGFPVVAVTTSRARVPALASMPAYRNATIVGVGPDRSVDHTDLLSALAIRRLVTVLDDASATHRQLRLPALS